MRCSEKKCCRCEQIKNVDCFHKLQKSSDGVDYSCKECKKEYNLKLLENSPELKEKRKQYKYEWGLKNNEKRREKYRLKVINNEIPPITPEQREKNKNYKREHYRSNREKVYNIKKRYAEKNKDLLRAKRQAKRLELTQGDRDRQNKYRREWRAKELERNPLFALKTRIRKYVGGSIKKMGFAKRNNTHVIIGCEFDVLKKHIERKFKKGMTWENYSSWEIDHIIPLRTAKSEDEVHSLWHYTNLQPLWAKENRIKSGKLPVNHQTILTI